MGFWSEHHAKTIKLYQGDVREVLKRLPDESVHCVVTSPPYWGLRDYGTGEWVGGKPGCTHVQGRPGAGRADGNVDERMQRNRDGAGAFSMTCKCGAVRVDKQIGLEPSYKEFVAEMVGVFREVRRVLRPDGTLWLNIGDSYANDGKWGGAAGGEHTDYLHGQASRIGREKRRTGLKPKDLCGVPWRVAFALQDDGWWLRQDIIWSKPNPMPESVTDRCTKAHEYLFLMTKSARYFYDAAAIQDFSVRSGSIPGGSKKHSADTVNDMRIRQGLELHSKRKVNEMRNKRSVWEVATAPFSEAHFATFPPKLIEPCIKAGCPKGGVVLDPFIGSGTTAKVARSLGRQCIGIDLSAEYLEMARQRLDLSKGSIDAGQLPDAHARRSRTAC